MHEIHTSARGVRKLVRRTTKKSYEAKEDNGEACGWASLTKEDKFGLEGP